MAEGSRILTGSEQLDAAMSSVAPASTRDTADVSSRASAREAATMVVKRGTRVSYTRMRPALPQCAYRTP